jgi:SAM-dependent methyltransferase
VTRAAPLTLDGAASFDASVVPRYLAFFGALATDLFLATPRAQVAHLGCRTGFPDAAIQEKAPGSRTIGVDPSAAAVELARSNARSVGLNAEYHHVADSLPTPLGNASFTHALSLHPLCDAAGRAALLGELRRVLIVGGQVLLAVPLRGSFPELADMMREYALRQDLAELGQTIDAAVASRPTPETLVEELEAAGFTDVDVDVQLLGVPFGNGREFLDDPIARLLVLPEAEITLGLAPEAATPAMQYLRDAIQKYWSEGSFELTVNAGCASGRK